MSNLLNQLGNNVLSVLALAALVVLTALGDVAATTTIPLITALAGVHIGSNLSSNISPSGSSTTTNNTTTTPPIQ